MKKIAITGLSGVIGNILIKEIPKNSYIIDLFHKEKYSGSTKIRNNVYLDLVDNEKILPTLEYMKPDVVIHMAAITHIDRCEMDKKEGKKGMVWKINVDASYEIAKYCAKNKVHMIFLSTECVFDGKSDNFTEDAKKNPINWYGYTKSKAEDLILSTGAPIAIIRSVVAYHKNDNGRTIYGKILNDLKSKKIIRVVDDQLFTPTNTLDIVRAINEVVNKRLLGIYHVAPKMSLSPYSFAKLIAKKNKFPFSKIKKTTLNSFYDSSSALLRLAHACLSADKSAKILKFTAKNPENVI